MFSVRITCCGMILVEVFYLSSALLVLHYNGALN